MKSDLSTRRCQPQTLWTARLAGQAHYQEGHAAARHSVGGPRQTGAAYLTHTRARLALAARHKRAAPCATGSRSDLQAPSDLEEVLAVSITSGPDTPDPNPDQGQDRDPLNWDRVLKLCALYLAQGIPPALIFLLANRR